MQFNVALEKQQHYGVVPNHYPKQKQIALQLLLIWFILAQKLHKLGGVIHHSPLGLPGPKQTPAFLGADPNGPPSCALCPPSLTRFSKKWPCFHRIGRVVFGKHTHQIPKKIIYLSRKSKDILSLVLLRHTPCSWIIVDSVGISPKDLKLWYPTTTNHNSVSNTQIVATCATFWNPLGWSYISLHLIPCLYSTLCLC